MDAQRARLAARVLERVPSIPPASASPPRPTVAAPRFLRRGWAAALGLGWPLAIMLSIAVEPAPADPDASVPLIVGLAGLALFIGLLATGVAAGLRQRWAAVAGVATGLLAMTFTVSCPATGHHTIGMWWVTQMVVTTAMLGVSLAALGRRATVSV
jgi:peptidoglycan/LPS O-acetylase OafA/YrhL